MKELNDYLLDKLYEIDESLKCCEKLVENLNSLYNDLSEQVIKYMQSKGIDELQTTEYIIRYKRWSDRIIIKRKTEDEKLMDYQEQLKKEDIGELDLSVRAFNCLRRACINTINELVSHKETDIMKIRCLGRKTFKEIKNKVLERGLRFADE